MSGWLRRPEASGDCAVLWDGMSMTTIVFFLLTEFVICLAWLEFVLFCFFMTREE